MSMLLISEKLLEEELKKKPQNPTDQQDFYYSMIEKEIYLLKRLKITLCNMRGDEKEVADRLENSEILICSLEEAESMRNSVLFKNDIADIIDKYGKDFFKKENINENFTRNKYWNIKTCGDEK